MGTLAAVVVEAYVEMWGGQVPELVPVEEDRATIGRASSNTVHVTGDPQVSRLHAVMERYPSGWCVRDLGSSNGTFVNGDRLVGEHRLSTGDEVRVGGTRLVFRLRDTEEVERTLSAEADPPELTRRELDVVRELCRPIVRSDSFAQPATIKEMAKALVVSDAAIKFHLSNLYDKFDIHETGLSRRAQLANEAVRRGAVSIAELQRGEQQRPRRDG